MIHATVFRHQITYRACEFILYVVLFGAADCFSVILFAEFKD
jgi:hypothetical protein